MLLLTLLGSALANGLSDTQTSYIGANMLEGEVDITFDAASPVNPAENPNSYSYFVGNTLYVGNEDSEGNSVDAIIEFFWFQSSIDRGSDFYVGIIKARSTPAHGEETLCNRLERLGNHPVLSVEHSAKIPAVHSAGNGLCHSTTESMHMVKSSWTPGRLWSHRTRFCHDTRWASWRNQHQRYPHCCRRRHPSKRIYRFRLQNQTQYDITLYEWDVYVNGRGDMMAWDTYLNLNARADQSISRIFPHCSGRWRRDLQHRRDQCSWKLQWRMVQPIWQ